MRIAAVILAAGASSRLGRPKQLVELEGEPLVRRAARLALEAGCDPVVAVLGCEAWAMGAALAGLPVAAVQNPRWAEGMASSIQRGIEALSGAAEAALLLACDQWALEAADLAALMEAFRAAPHRAAAASYAETRGIPAVFPRASFTALGSLSGDHGAKALLQGEVTLVELPRACADLDDEADLGRLP